MGTITLDTKNVFKSKRQAFCSSGLNFNLPVLIDSIKQSLSWEKGELNAKILLRSPHKQVLLTAMHKGTEIVSSQSGDSVSIQVIEGKLCFHTRKETVTFSAGQVLTIYDKVKYSLSAEEETVFLLTLETDNLKLVAN